MAATTIAIVLCEFILAYPVYMFYRGYNSSFYSRPNASFFFIPDPDVGYVSSPNLNIKRRKSFVTPNAPRFDGFFDVQTNRYGFRYSDDLEKLKPTGEVRVFCLGGSTTYGKGSPNNGTYPQQIEDILGDPKLRVINAGVNSYRSIHLLHFYKSVIRNFDPDIITIYSGWNDYTEYLNGYGDYWKPRDPFSHDFRGSFNLFSSFANRFALGNVLIKAYYNLTKDKVVQNKNNYLVGASETAWQEEYKTNMRELIQLAKSDGVSLIIIIFPSPQFDDAPMEAKEFADKDLVMSGNWDAYTLFLKTIRKIQRDLSVEHNIPLIDANSPFSKMNQDYKKKFSYFTDPMHLTPEGNTLVAREMAPALKNIISTKAAKNTI